ncbi:hypothetical protein RB195_006593 [Necator americanus]|uniref:Secreted protein n=1 Tax=Necator americanus TaxID=51031 RepID=A0ABR1BTC8_NECAM
MYPMVSSCNFLRANILRVILVYTSHSSCVDIRKRSHGDHVTVWWHYPDVAQLSRFSSLHRIRPCTVLRFAHPTKTH